MNNFKRLSLCIMALISTMPLMAMNENEKKRAKQEEKGAPGTQSSKEDALLALQVTQFYVNIVKAKMMRDTEELKIRLEIAEASKAEQSKEVPAPSCSTANDSNAQPQQPAEKAMTSKELLTQLNESHETIDHLVSTTGNLAKQILVTLKNKPQDDDTDHDDDDRGQSSGISNNNQ